MSSHATAELLSAYLDQELPPEEVEVLESHLDHCHECHGRLAGLSTVVGNLRHMERIAPPPTLDLTVARRIALAGENKNLLDRFEDGLEAFQRKSSLMMWFCMVLALVLIVFFFLSTLANKQNTNIPVVFGDTPSPINAVAPDDGGDDPAPTARIFQQQGGELKEIGAVGSRIELAGRVFERGDDDIWFDVQIQTAPSATATDALRQIVRGSDDFDQLLARYPDLAPLQTLEGTTYLLLDGEVVRLTWPSSGTAAANP